MKIFLILFLLISICESQQDPSLLVHGLFSDNSENITLIYYGTYNVNNSQFTIINSLKVDDVGNPRHQRYDVTPIAYDPNTDVIYMSAIKNHNETLLSVIDATTGSLLKTYSMENHIVSLQFDIFGKQLFAHVETDHEQESQIVEIDTTTGKFKQVLGTIREAIPTHVSSFCPICKKYFLMVRQAGHHIYIGVNSTDGGGISWQTPIDVDPVSIHFDYKTFTMYTVYYNESATDVYRLGILNRTIGGIGKEIATLTRGGNVAVSSVSAYDIYADMFYSLIVTLSPPALEISYVNVNTSDAKEIPLLRNAYIPYTWFIKQFVH
jgi:hypothetical protein